MAGLDEQDADEEGDSCVPFAGVDAFVPELFGRMMGVDGVLEIEVLVGGVFPT